MPVDDHLDRIGAEYIDIYSIDDDNDGLNNITENTLGINTDPNNADSDNDLIPDGYEYYSNVLNPTDGSDAGQDQDVDGFTSLEEYNGCTISAMRHCNESYRSDPGNSASTPLSKQAAILGIVNSIILN